MGHIFEDRLDEIIERYDCVAPELANSTLINNMIMDVFNKRCSGKTVAIWGLGRKMQ